jgi:hypothetical protein
VATAARVSDRVPDIAFLYLLESRVCISTKFLHDNIYRRHETISVVKEGAQSNLRTNPARPVFLVQICPRRGDSTRAFELKGVFTV